MRFPVGTHLRMARCKPAVDVGPSKEVGRIPVKKARKKASTKRSAMHRPSTSLRSQGAPAASPQGVSEPSLPNRWTFLTNHAHVLALVHAEPDLVLRQVALRVGITERAVQRIVQDLEEEGYLVREKIGRRNRYQVVTDQPLRHPIEAHRNIGELLRLVAR